jgi:hypothetical protein
MAKRILFIFLFIFPFYSSAQQNSKITETLAKAVQGVLTPENGISVRAVIYNGDTIPYAVLPTVTCYTSRVFKNKKDAVKWDRLKYNVKKVYPYAILASAKLKEYDKLLANIPNENDRKKYMKLAEKQLKDEFGDQLKDLTMTQGRILIKLIDRETGKTTYNMWQSVAVMFSSSLKDEYDGDGEDKAIEDAIRLVESGDF